MNIIMGIIIGIIVLTMVGIYMFLFESRKQIRIYWNELDNALQRKYLLIEDLARTVEEYTLSGTEMSDRIKMYMRAQKKTKIKNKKIEIEQQLRGELKSIVLIAKGYPELLDMNNYKSTINELEEAEEKIIRIGKKYNNFVKTYNKKIHKFPIKLVKERLGYEDEIIFEID